MRTSIAPLVCCFFLPRLPAPRASQALPVPDLPPNHWAYNSVRWAMQAGICEGRPDGMLYPEQPITRFDLAIAVSRFIERAENHLRIKFRPTEEGSLGPELIDMPFHHYWFDPVSGLIARHVLPYVGEKKFRPKDPATRLDFAMWIIRLLGRGEEADPLLSHHPFRDLNPPTEGYSRILRQMGVIAGRDSSVPYAEDREYMRRCEVFVALHRLWNVLERSPQEASPQQVVGVTTVLPSPAP